MQLNNQETANQTLRIAYFPDSYEEVNGVATTSRHLTDYVSARGLPFLCVHAGSVTNYSSTGNLSFLSLKRSPLAIRVDETLAFDPIFQIYAGRIRREVEKFRPDVIHITGINDVGIAGAYLGWKMDLPIVGSWHTNLHEYAVRRLRGLLRLLPKETARSIGDFLERQILYGAKQYYRIPQILLAPNAELVEMLAEGTGRVTHLMIRGVDTELFSPEKRTVADDIFRFGYTGRLRAEKNVRMLAEIEKALLASGRNNFRFLVVGEGTEREWLERNLQNGEFTGFLTGEQLSEAYANMDVFLFPSETDTFGNVPQEAMASGAAPIVSNKGGPKFIVEHKRTGFVADSASDFARYAIDLFDNREKLERMRAAALKFARSRSWDSVFDGVYDAYREAYERKRDRKKDRA